MLEEGLSPPSTTTTAPTGAGGAAGGDGRKSHQIHRRESSKWIPREAPISQRIIQPIRQRFDRDSANTRQIEPNWRFTNLPRWKLKNYQKFCSNKITTTKYHVYNFIFKNLWEQFHRWANPYFIFIAGLNWIPALQSFSKVLGLVPVTLILALTAIKDAFEDYRRHLADKKINNQTTHVWSSEKNRCRKMPWEHIIVGDYVHVSIDETIPADLLLIRSSDPQGLVFVETSNLDGESNLKQRSVMPKCRSLCDETGDFDPSPLNIKVFCNPPDKRLNFIQGYVEYANEEEDRITKDNIIIRGCKLRNTTFIEGIVLYTGKETKAMLNNGEIKMKQSSLEKQTNIFVVYCVVLLIFMCFSGGGLSISWLVRHAAHEIMNGIPYVVLYTSSAVGDGFINMATFVISYQILIPLSLYITVELIKLGQLYFLNNDLEMYDEVTDKRILCRSFTIAEELGQIQYILSDKTGTLTENKMVFKYCAVNGNAYEPSLAQSPMSNKSFGDRSMDDDDEPIQVNEALRQALPRVADDHNDPQYSALYYFFLNLAVCNNVMVANQKHDQINNGYMEGEAFRISNSLFYLRPSDYPPTEESTPTNDRSGRSTNIQTPSSSRLVSILNPADIVRRLSSLNISSLFRKEEKVKLKSKKQLKIYEAESPDEYCLVNAAKSYGFKLVSRDLTHVNVTLPTQREYPRRLKLRVEKYLKFDSNRKRMSVVLDMGDRKLLFCKGADDEILANLCQITLEQNLEAKTVVENSKIFLKQYSRNGLRTLCMAMKSMSNEEYNRWEVQHEAIENSDFPDQDEQISQSYRRLETNLKFLGLTAIEDRLQDGVEETISSLRKAGIQIWVLTGDKKDTAINIAKSCQLFDSQTEICACSTEEDLINLLSFPGKYNVAFSAPIVKLLENGNPKAIGAIQKASAVLCYRMTPCEKETVVKTVKKYLKGKVLAVGDGANDVPMIQAADVGIGISGQEGLQAVMASDFALARFKFLKKLLLVHGHWFYYRLANVLLYFLYKNAMFVFVLYWAQFYSGFSANGIMDPLYMMLYPIIFTSVQPLAYGILDQDIEAEILLKDPSLYGKGIRGTIYKTSNFFLHMADAIWQSGVVYFIALGAYADSTVEAWEFGFVLASSLFFCNDLHLALITRCWTKPTFFVHGFFIAVHYLFFIVYTSITLPIFGTKSTPVGVALRCIHNPVYWATLFISIILALLPRFIIKVCQNRVSPGLVFKASLAERNVQPDCLPSCISGCTFL